MGESSLLLATLRKALSLVPFIAVLVAIDHILVRGRIGEQALHQADCLAFYWCSGTSGRASQSFTV